MIRTAVGFFFVILLGALVSSFLGGVFAWIIATISPEFVRGLFSLSQDTHSVSRYAFTVGMIWGLFIGAAVSGFACGLSTVLKLIRLRIEHTSRKSD
ncbi:MAG: hypothetical protein IAE97_09840 [Chthoniobacterales bacterium]|nr:hypothetical protein [Chthoniobacterales bacterium]